MIRQIASLTMLAGSGMLLVGHTYLGANDIAPRLIAVHGTERAAEMAHAGTGAVLQALIMDQIVWGLPYLAIGGLLGIVARVAVLKWAKVDVGDAQEKYYALDEAGGRHVMFGMPFAHRAEMTKWPLADVSDIPGIEEASAFESEMLAAYRAGGHPADVDGYHGVTLYEHCKSVWTIAVDLYGVGTLEALLALTHDAGKMLTFHRTDAGAWTRSSPQHEMNNPEAVRRLPSFWSSPAEERSLLLLSLHYMAGTIAAKDVPPEVVTAVQRVKVLDVQTTAKEVSAPRGAGYINNAAILNAVIALAGQPPIDWNINRSQSASAPAGAIHLGEGVLLISGRAIRSAIAALLDPQDAAALSLNTPTTEWHAAYDVIAQSIKAAGVGTRIVQNVASESGWFSVRVGQARMPHAIAIRTTASPAQISRWGQSQMEIVISEIRKPAQ